MISPGAFRAWSLPSTIDVPADSGVARKGAGEVRALSIDDGWLRGAARALRRAGPALRDRPVGDLVRVLGTAGARFLDPADPLRAAALESLPPTSGLSPSMAREVLDGMARDWTRDALTTLVRADFPDPAVLDDFVASGSGRVAAVGPGLCVQVVSGSVPGVGASALLRSLLVKAPTLLKPGRGDVVLPVLLADAIREVDAAVGEALAVAYWPGGSPQLDAAAVAEADLVAAYGGDDAVRALRDLSAVHTRFVAYHHRFSVGIVGRRALGADRRRVAASVARALALFDQRGCVSPRIVYVEEGGEASVRTFASDVADALRVLEAHLPGGELDASEAAAVHQVRGTAELLAASGAGLEIRHGGAATWSVIYDPDSALSSGCVGRVVRVRPVADAGEVPELVRPFGAHLQSVAVEGLGEALPQVARRLGRVGATRITSFDAVAFPPPGWHHDGRGPLEALVTWVDMEV